MKLLNNRAACEALGITEHTIWRWRKEGKGPKYYQFGRSIRYKIEDIEEWIEEHKNET